MPKSFDLAVIGTGSAAAGVASRCRDSGWKVAIIDSRPYGGTCALRGCDPKKVLVGATEARNTHEIRRVRPISSLAVFAFVHVEIRILFQCLQPWAFGNRCG